MKRKKRKTPREDEVAKYWETHDATEALDLSTEKRVALIYEPPVQAISLRLPVPLLTRIKRAAAQMDIAYQALIKIWLAEKVHEVRPAPR